MSAPRIAEQLDIPVGTVASRLRLGKQALLASMGLPAAPEGEEPVLIALDQWARDIAERLGAR